MTTNQQPTDILSKTTGLECLNCGGIFFETSLVLRKLSKLYIAELYPGFQGPIKDQIVPVECFTCKDCGTPLKQFFPEGMSDVEEKLGLSKINSPKFEM